MLNRSGIIALIVITAIGAASGITNAADPSREDVLAAMRSASDYMANTVSNNGGYLHTYKEDFTEQWGEAPARPTQIWVQSGTPRMGELFLSAYRATGDPVYLEYAKRAANALIYGQHPAGGWHYLIDFDMTGIEEYYRTTASQYINGMEEHRHFWGNCTFDDDVTQSATRYLLHLYMETLDPAYRTPLLKALDFMLESQYPTGGWPQRYPLKYDYAHDGLPDYSSNYTMNDGAMRNTIYTLVEAYEKLGDERYLDAAKRGVDFIIMIQGPEGQAAWAEQYYMDFTPAWARTHEPPGIMPRVTIDCIRVLERFYLMTGDRRYLAPIPGAIKWFRDSTLSIEPDGRAFMGRFYTPGDNLPIHKHWTGEYNEEGYETFYYNQDPTGNTGSWAGVRHDVDAYVREFERVNALTPEEARAEYKQRRDREEHPEPRTADPAEVRDIMDTLDDKGVWIEEFSAIDMTRSMLKLRTGDMSTKIKRNKTVRGISTGTFRSNMKTMIDYVRSE
jgi:PelA/Pel-15E family pectate lyase